MKPKKGTGSRKRGQEAEKGDKAEKGDSRKRGQPKKGTVATRRRRQKD